MRKPVVSRQPNRIAVLVNRPGGLTAEEAISAAEANLDTVRTRTMQELDSIVIQMRQLALTLEGGQSAGGAKELYRLSNSVIGIAGAIGLQGLSDVAYSFCELIDRLRSGCTWNKESIRVHLESMMVLQSTNPSEQEGARIKQALRLLVERTPAGGRARQASGADNPVVGQIRTPQP